MNPPKPIIENPQLQELVMDLPIELINCIILDLSELSIEQIIFKYNLV